MNLYEVAFSGKLLAGAELETVKANLARIFQADAQRIALLFSGRRIVIKSNLDAAGAERYRETLARAGALLEVRALEPTPQVENLPKATVAPAVDSPAAPVSSSARARLKVAPRDEYMAAFVDVDAPDLGISPLGADLQDQPQPVVAPQVDLSQFSLAPVGSDMGQEQGHPAPPPPDTSHLQLKD